MLLVNPPPTPTQGCSEGLVPTTPVLSTQYPSTSGIPSTGYPVLGYFWHPQYWVPSTGVLGTVLLASPVLGTQYWGTGYPVPQYWTPTTPVLGTQYPSTTGIICSICCVHLIVVKQWSNYSIIYEGPQNITSDSEPRNFFLRPLEAPRSQISGSKSISALVHRMILCSHGLMCDFMGPIAALLYPLKRDVSRGHHFFQRRQAPSGPT